MHSLYSFTVPVFIKALGGLHAVLEKAKEHGVDETHLLVDALAPDMFPFARQVQIACDNAKGATARLAGMEIPAFEDNETSLDLLQARIKKTIDFLNTVSESAFEGAEERKIVLPYFPNKFLYGFDYAREYALPNFFFHAAMAYALVRKNGVAIGKANYINGLPFQDM